MVPGELMARLQEQEPSVKILWCKDSRQVFLLFGKKKVISE